MSLLTGVSEVICVIMNSFFFQVLLNTQSELQSELLLVKREKREKDVAVDTLNKTTQDLQAECRTLQDALVSAKGTMYMHYTIILYLLFCVMFSHISGVMNESTKKEINRIVELEKRLA